MTDLPAAFDRRAAFLPAADAVVLADVHLGKSRDSNVAFPVDEFGDVRERLLAVVERFDPTEVVVAGDLLHAFDRVPPAVADGVPDLATAVVDAGADLVVTPGNHDTVLDGVLAEASMTVPTPDEHRLDDGTVVLHGHEPPESDAERYVFGHDHPAITIEGRKHPCFLYGDGVYRDADVLVVPAFGRVARGATVDGMGGSDFLSPVLAGGIDEYRPVVYDEGGAEALAFPPMAELRDHL